MEVQVSAIAWSAFVRQSIVKRLLPRVIEIAGRFGREHEPPRLEDLPQSPDLFRSYRRWLAHPDVRRAPGGWLYRGRFWPDYLTVGGAGLAVARVAAVHCQGRGVDIGAGFWCFPGAEPIDPMRGPGRSRSIEDVAPASLDFVFSSHCLEHIVDWRAALAGWVQRLRRGGVIFLYLPHPACPLWEPGSPFVGQGHVWSPALDVVAAELGRLGCEMVAEDAGPDFMESFYVCARRSTAG